MPQALSDQRIKLALAVMIGFLALIVVAWFAGTVSTSHSVHISSVPVSNPSPAPVSS